MKTCTRCQESKPLDAFPWNKDKRLKVGGRYGSWCKECHRQYARPYRKTYYEKNAEAVKESQREAHRADPGYLKRWREANPEKYRAYVGSSSAKRRASKKQATASWADPAKINAVYTYAAELRGKGIDCRVDHIVPLNGDTASGLHTQDNLQVVLAGQSMRKHNTVPEDPMGVTPTRVALATPEE